LRQVLTFILPDLSAELTFELVKINTVNLVLLEYRSSLNYERLTTGTDLLSQVLSQFIISESVQSRKISSNEVDSWEKVLKFIEEQVESQSLIRHDDHSLRIQREIHYMLAAIIENVGDHVLAVYNRALSLGLTAMNHYDSVVKGYGAKIFRAMVSYASLAKHYREINGYFETKGSMQLNLMRMMIT